MKAEYDFSKGERGKFYRPDAKFNVPVYLDKDILTYLTEKAKAKGVEVSSSSTISSGKTSTCSKP